MTTSFTRIAAVAAAGLLVAGLAAAQSAGTTMLRLGATQIKPNVDSGDLSPPAFAGTKADIRANTQLSGGLTYMLTDDISVDLPLATPYKHEIVGAGAIAGVGKIGEVRALPFTVFGQFRFLEVQSPLRPYLGLGLTYAKFYKARSTAALSALTGGTPSNPTTLTVKSKFALTPQIGASWFVNEQWFINVSWSRTFLKTRTTLSTGQTLDATLNPDARGLTVGYKF
jgi:outer membrane protein